MSLSYRHLAGSAAFAAMAFCCGFGLALAREDIVRAIPLLSTSETILGEPIAYPAGKPKLTAAILALAPGQETGWHTHGVPLTGIMLEGELTVDYGDKGKRTYKKGEAVAETMATPHNGRNTGDGNVQLFVVFIGAEGLANTTPFAK
ncbi:MAG: cupin domain-containing protein [Hyphomicrobium sp.]